MRMASQGSAVLTVAITSLALSASARAVEIEQLLGRWSSTEFDECQYADDSEGAPLHIRQENGETLISNYGFLCSVKDWKQDGDFLVGSAKACGMEGGEDTFDETYRLGLNDKGELLMSETETTGLRRCPAVQ